MIQGSPLAIMKGGLNSREVFNPSLIQGVPLDTMNEGLKYHEVFDPSQVFVYPKWLVSRVNSLLLSSYFINLVQTQFHIQLYAGAEAKHNSEVIILSRTLWHYATC
jgi:hypothetical protein